MDLVADSFELLALLGLNLILLLGKSIEILLVPLLLLLDADLDRSQVLLQLSLIDPVFILDVFKGDLSLLLELCELVLVLKHQMLRSLLVYLNLNLVLLFQVLKLSILVPELSLLILKLLLTNEPKVVDSESLIIVKTGQLLLLLDLLFEVSALKSK